MTSRIVVALRVAADPARAFDVFTREIALWWRPNGMFQFTPRGAGRLAFEPGIGGRFTETQEDGAVFEIGQITAWEPGARLAFSWRQASFAAGEETHVDIRFEPVGSETRITVEHRGWETVPQRHVARHTMPDGLFLRHHGEWWQGLLVAFRGRLGWE